MAFNDIKPSAKNHLLVIPKDHFTDVKSLTIETVSMGKLSDYQLQ